MNDKEQAEFDQWIDMWAEMSADEEKTAKPAKKVVTSFFTDSPIDTEYVTDDTTDDWYDIANRAEDMLTENSFKDIARGDKQVTKGDISYYQNPQRISNIGPDAADEKGNLRVSKNLVNGDQLEELNDLKIKMHHLEDQFMRAEVRKEASPREKFLKELNSLRAEVVALSEKIQSRPDVDPT